MVMNMFLRGLTWKHCLVYIDDIIAGAQKCNCIGLKDRILPQASSEFFPYLNYDDSDPKRKDIFIIFESI